MYMHIVYIQYTFCEVLNEVPTALEEAAADQHDLGSVGGLETKTLMLLATSQVT